MGANQTPYLNLNFGTDAERNQNWAKLDARILELARGIFADVPAGGDLQGYYPDPRLADHIYARLPPTASVPADSGKVLTVAPDGTFVWQNPSSSGANPIGPASGDLTGSYPGPFLRSLVSISSFGLAARGAIYSGPGGFSTGVNVSNHDANFVATSASWQENFLNGLGSDEWNVQRRAPNASANAYTSLLTVRADGTIRATTDPVATFDLVTKQYVDLRAVPGGGPTGAVLAKNSNTSLDLVWKTLIGLPAGGTVNQVLGKASAADYDVSWQTVAAVAQYWTDDGTSLIPSPNTRKVFMAAATQDIFIYGPGVPRARLSVHPDGRSGSYWLWNRSITGALDDGSMSSWGVFIESDAFDIARANPGVVMPTTLLQVRPDGTVGVTTGPVAALDLATKQYVDTSAAGSHWTVDAPSQLLTPTNWASNTGIWFPGPVSTFNMTPSTYLYSTGGVNDQTANLDITTLGTTRLLSKWYTQTALQTSLAGSVILPALAGGGVVIDNERLVVAGGIKLAAALQTGDGTIQYTGGHFMGRVAGVWTQLDNAGAGLPAGGASGAVLTKNTPADYDASWIIPSSGGSNGSLGTQIICTTNTVLTTANHDVLINANAADVQVTLPAFSTTLSGQVYRITRVDVQSARQATIMPAGADFIDGVNAFITIAPNESVTLMAAGTVANNQQWLRVADPVWKTIQAGNVLTPRDSGKYIVSTAVGDAIQWSSRTAKGRLIAARAADTAAFTELTHNFSYNGNSFGGASDDTSQPSWMIRMRATTGTADDFAVLRAPAASGFPALASLLSIDGVSGKTTLTLADASVSTAMLVPGATVKQLVTANFNVSQSITGDSTWHQVTTTTACTITVRANARVFLFATMSAAGVFSSGTSFYYGFTMDAASPNMLQQMWNTGVSIMMPSFFGYITPALAVGAHTFTFMIWANTGSIALSSSLPGTIYAYELA